jgi:hypothetical protein
MQISPIRQLLLVQISQFLFGGLTKGRSISPYAGILLTCKDAIHLPIGGLFEFASSCSAD